MKKRGKKGVAFETLAKWIIAILALVIIVLGVMVLKSRGNSLISKIAELLRFGR